MPTVPILRGPQVAPTVQGVTPLRQPDIQNAGPQQMQQFGQALAGAGSQAAGIIERELQRQNDDMVQAAMNDAVLARTQHTVDPQAGFMTVRGSDAMALHEGKGLDVVYADRLRADFDAIGQRLTNPAQRRAFRVQTDQMLGAFREKVLSHAGSEAQRFRIDTQTGTVATAQKAMALQWADPDMVAQGQQAIKAATMELGRLQGWSREQTTSAMVEALSPGHAAVISGALQSGNVEYARAYADRVNAELTPADRLKLGNNLKSVSLEVEASNKADELWLTLGPGNDRGAPVDLFAMERAARKAFEGEPDKAKATIAGLRERAQAFNASQAEFHAANTTAVYRMLDSGAPMSSIRRSAQWLELPGQQQRQIMLSLEQEAAARESRAAAREGRELTRMQREQAMTLLRNGDAYLRYGDPQVLAGMSRQQVEALRPTFGMDGTQHLLNKWDALQKPQAKMAATIDKQDFDAVADRMGLKPYDPRKSEDERRQLGELQFRVETLIDRAQIGKGATLTREEKRELMTRELALAVSVDRPYWFGSNSVPVIQLTGEQARRVVVPPAERALIVQALQARYQQDQLPQYEPTEDNIRRLYLLRQSPAAELIPNEQQ